jgi:hypothetical protein
MADTIASALRTNQVKALADVLHTFLDTDASFCAGRKVDGSPAIDPLDPSRHPADLRRRTWALDLRDRLAADGFTDEVVVDLARMIGRFPYQLPMTKRETINKTWLRLINETVGVIAGWADLPTQIDSDGLRMITEEPITDEPTDPTPDPAPAPEPLPDFNRDIPSDPDDETFPGMPDPTADPGPRIRIPSTKLPTMSRAYRPDPAPEPLSDDAEFSDPDRPTDSELAIAAGWDTEELAAGSVDGAIIDTLDAHELLNASLSDLSDLTGCVIRCQLAPDGSPGPYLLTVTRRADGPDRWIVEGPGGFSASIDGTWIMANREPIGKSGPGIAPERPAAPDVHSTDPAPESGSEGNVDNPKTVPYGWGSVGGGGSPGDARADAPKPVAKPKRQPFGSPGSSVHESNVTGYTGGRYHTILKSSDGRTILDARSEVAQEYRSDEQGTTYALAFALPRGRWIIGYALGLGEMLFRGELRTDLADDSEARQAARDVAERLIELDAEEDARFDAQESDDDSDDSDDSDDDEGPSDPPTVPRIADLDPFTQAYLEAALWATTGDDDESLDGLYTVDDIADESLIEHAEACRQFQEANAADLDGRNLILAGQDFWLTRNGHGAGYWGGDYPDGAGQRLTDAAHAWGYSDACVGDDGHIHLT